MLYLAQANNRLAPNGALIQGQNLNLISGGNLVNQGTLRASDSLSAVAANINYSGLIEAGKRLDLLASDSIRNTAGGVISGRDVSLTALTGNVLNERVVCLPSPPVPARPRMRTGHRGWAAGAATLRGGEATLSCGQGRTTVLRGVPDKSPEGCEAAQR
ncbi:hypothetical protein D3C76_607920 [compost metagenome]